MIPAEAVEAAAKALAKADLRGGFSKDDYADARAALEAAAPHIRAAAWEEGYLYSYDQERGGNGELPIPVPEYIAEDLVHWNPYRKESSND